MQPSNSLFTKKLTKLKILLVEDSIDDAYFTQEAVQKAVKSLGLEIELTIVEDGTKAVEFLTNHECNLIITDLQMPKMNGFELLNYLKATNSYKLIPVIFLTTSDRQKDVQKAYLSNAAAYLCKPISSAKFQSIVKDMISFWSQVMLPLSDRDKR